MAVAVGQVLVDGSGPYARRGTAIPAPVLSARRRPQDARLCQRDDQVELVEAVRICDEVDRGDLRARGGEPEEHAYRSARRPRDRGFSVDQSWYGALRAAAELGDRQGATSLARGAQLDGCAIGAEDDIGVEHRKKLAELTVACSGKEGFDQLRLA